ncbi:MAG: right-handed parallel beta-helix repeat-containing protein [Pyrinomonadaceae bacterium]
MRTFILTLMTALVLSGCASAATSPSQNKGKQNTRVANDFPGADLGAKINAANASLGGSPGEILVRGGGTISTQVIITPGHTLRFSAGTYTLQTERLWEGAFLLQSKTSVVGSGWDTIIVEPPKVGWIVFQSFADASSQPVHSGTDSDIRITDLQIKGANPAVEGGVRQTVVLGNCHRCGVENLWLNGTGVIGIQAGGTAVAGNFADGVTIKKNLLSHVASQAVAVVNGQNVVIDSNTFKDSGRCCAEGMTPIDLEPNDPRDIIRNIEITNNTIDSRNSNFIHGNGILVQNGARTSGYGPVLVQNNTVIGGELLPPLAGYISVGIYVTAFTENVKIINNTVRRVAHSGIRLENTTRNYVSGNKLISTGTGGIISFEVTNTTDSQIFDNVVAIDPNSPLGTEIIQEAGTAARNSYRGNSSSRGALAPNIVGRKP